MLQTLERVNGNLAKRFWLYWCHGLAAAVSLSFKYIRVIIKLIFVQIVVGSIVAKAPESPLAQPALDQVNAAFALFERAAAQQPEPVGRPAKALVSLRFCSPSSGYDNFIGCGYPFALPRSSSICSLPSVWKTWHRFYPYGFL